MNGNHCEHKQSINSASGHTIKIADRRYRSQSTSLQTTSGDPSEQKANAQQTTSTTHRSRHHMRVLSWSPFGDSLRPGQDAHAQPLSDATLQALTTSASSQHTAECRAKPQAFRRVLRRSLRAIHAMSARHSPCHVVAAVCSPVAHGCPAPAVRRAGLHHFSNRMPHDRRKVFSFQFSPRIRCFVLFHILPHGWCWLSSFVRIELLPPADNLLRESARVNKSHARSGSHGRRIGWADR